MNEDLSVGKLFLALIVGGILIYLGVSWIRINHEANRATLEEYRKQYLEEMEASRLWTEKQEKIKMDALREYCEKHGPKNIEENEECFRLNIKG